MGVLHEAKQLNFSSVPAGTPESESRLLVQGVEGLQRLEIGRTSFQACLREHGYHRSRSICQPYKRTSDEICQQEAGPGSNDNRQLSDALGEHQRIRFPTILPDRSSTTKDLAGKGNNYLDCAGLASTSVVPDTFTVIDSGTDFVAANEEVVTERERGNSPVNEDGNAQMGGMESVRLRVTEEGFSEEATELLMGKWREGTKVSYKCAWDKWSSWARSRKINPFQASIAHIVNFLSAMCREGKAYSTINGYRSAISAIHPHIGKRPVGEHPDVKGVMTGIFNKNPPTPKYTHFWDVETVLAYIRALGSNDRLLVRDLAMKLAMLIALTTASRSADLSLLDTRFMVDQGDKMVFFIKELGKTRKVGQSPPKVEICGFEDPDLDPLMCLNEYLTRTKKLRPLEGNNLFLSSVSPYRPAKASTIAGWLKTVFGQGGGGHLDLDGTLYEGS